MSNPIHVIMIEDHSVVRSGLRRQFQDFKEIRMMAEAASAAEGIALVKQHQPDVVLLDAMLPDMDGLEVVRRLLRIKPDLKIVVVSANVQAPYPKLFLQNGALGYVSKHSDFKEIVDATRKAALGQRYVSNRVAQQLVMEDMAQPTNNHHDIVEKLSKRELQIMMLIVKSKKVPNIASQLALSGKTVNSYRYRLFKKLGINSDVELVHLAYRLGLLSDTTEA